MSRARPFSARLNASVLERLERRGAHTGLNKSRLAERYIDEGMRMDEHPWIVFRDGPAGRRAALAGGPDVWEVVAVVRESGRSGEPAVRHAAKWLDLSPERVRAAMRYRAHYPEEIDERIARNEREADAAEADWLREQAALA